MTLTPEQIVALGTVLVSLAGVGLQAWRASRNSHDVDKKIARFEGRLVEQRSQIDSLYRELVRSQNAMDAKDKKIAEQAHEIERLQTRVLALEKLLDNLSHPA